MKGTNEDVLSPFGSSGSSPFGSSGASPFGSSDRSPFGSSDRSPFGSSPFGSSEPDYSGSGVRGSGSSQSGPAGSGTDEDLRISDFLELDEEAPFWTDDRTSEDKEKPEKDSKESEERKNSGLGDGKTVQVRVYTSQTNRSRIARIYSIVQGGSYLDAMKKLSTSPVIVSIQSGKAGEFIGFVKRQGGFAEIV